MQNALRDTAHSQTVDKLKAELDQAASGVIY